MTCIRPLRQILSISHSNNDTSYGGRNNEKGLVSWRDARFCCSHTPADIVTHIALLPPWLHDPGMIPTFMENTSVTLVTYMKTTCEWLLIASNLGKKALWRVSRAIGCPRAAQLPPANKFLPFERRLKGQ